MQELTEVQQIVQELCLMNNKFMNKVFDNNIPAAELLLRIILKNDKIKVKEVKVQIYMVIPHKWTFWQRMKQVCILMLRYNAAMKVRLQKEHAFTAACWTVIC